MSEFDYHFISLNLAMVGLFFVCNAILQKKPKHILEEAFGVSSGVLRDLRASVFKKHQMILGYGVILLAIVLNIFHQSLADSDGDSLLDSREPALLTTALICSVATICGVLNYLSRIFSKWHFRRIVTEVVTERHLPFESNVQLAVELGQILGVPLAQGDSVDQYLLKLRKHLDLPLEDPTRRSRNSRVGVDFR